MTISRLPTIPVAELGRILDGSGAWEWRFEVKRPSDTSWTNLSDVAGGDWLVGVETQPDSPDQPVGMFRLAFMARAENRRVAPGISADALNINAEAVFAPILYAGNFVRGWAANHSEVGANDGVFRLWLVGRIDDVEWPEDDVVCSCSTPDEELRRTWITEIEERGAEDPGVPLQTEMQSLLTKYAPWAGAMRVEDDPELGVGKYETTREALGPKLLKWAKGIGFDARYLWDETAGDFVYTLYLPPRDKVVADLGVGPDHVLAVPALRVSREYVTNDFWLEYPDAAAGERRAVTDQDVASQEQFGEVWMGITEPDDSLIQTEASARGLLGWAKHDLSQPPTTKRIRIPFLPWLTLHDMLQVDPDDARFDYQTLWSVVGVQHHVTVEDVYTEVSLRGGSPVGQYFDWLARGNRPHPIIGGDEYAISGVVWTPGGVTGSLDWSVGAAITESWLGYALVRTPVTVDDWDSVAASVLPVAAGEPPVTLPVPVETEDGADNLLVQIEARYNDPATGDLKVGDVHRVTIYPKTFVPGVDPDTGVIINEPLQPPSLYAFSFPGSALDTTDIHGRITDASGGAITLNVWTAKSTYDNPDPDAAPDGTLRIGSTPANFGPDTTFGAAGKLLDEVMSHPAEPKTVYLEAVADDGRTTGKVAVPLSVRLSGLINELGELEAESAVGWLNFITEEQPPLFFADAAARVAGLSAAAEGRYAWQADDLTEWQKQGGAWVLSPFPEYLKAFLIVGAVRAAALDVDVFEATSAHIKQAMVNEAWIEVLTALQANIVSLSEIVPGMGVVLTGKLQNAAGTAIFDLDATGTQPNLLIGDWLQVSQDEGIWLGSAPFVESAANSYADSAAAAAESAANAYTDSQITTSTGNTITRAATAPASPKVGDMWVDTSQGSRVKTWDGDSWEPTDTTINGGRITTGTIAAGVVFAGELSAVTGTFAGSLSAATGTFRGTVSANAVVAASSFTGTSARFTGAGPGGESAALYIGNADALGERELRLHDGGLGLVENDGSAFGFSIISLQTQPGDSGGVTAGNDLHLFARGGGATGGNVYVNYLGNEDIDSSVDNQVIIDSGLRVLGRNSIGTFNRDYFRIHSDMSPPTDQTVAELRVNIGGAIVQRRVKIGASGSAGALKRALYIDD